MGNKAARLAGRMDDLAFLARKRAALWAELPDHDIETTPDAWPAVAALIEAATEDARPPHPHLVRHMLADHLALALPAARALGHLRGLLPPADPRHAVVGRVMEATSTQWLWWWRERGLGGAEVLQVLSALWGRDHG
jgi:hypothetical protein